MISTVLMEKGFVSFVTCNRCLNLKKNCNGREWRINIFCTGVPSSEIMGQVWGLLANHTASWLVWCLALANHTASCRTIDSKIECLHFIVSFRYYSDDISLDIKKLELAVHKKCVMLIFYGNYLTLFASLISVSFQFTYYVIINILYNVNNGILLLN